MVTQSKTPDTIKASEFKAKCLKLMDRVAETGESVVITKNGQAVARLGPVTPRPATLCGVHRGKITIVGDILSPVDVEWEAAR
jgi:prevent-host-death family protein